MAAAYVVAAMAMSSAIVAMLISAAIITNDIATAIPPIVVFGAFIAGYALIGLRIYRGFNETLSVADDQAPTTTSRTTLAHGSSA